MIWDFSFGRLFGSLFICWAAGLASFLFAIPSLDSWYAQLTKPSVAPPQWLFLPLWLLLYTLMGVGLYFLWNEDTKRVEVKKALLLFIMQLLLSVLWSSSFFGLRSLWISALVSVLLFLVLFQTILRLYKLPSVAAWLLIPQLLWSGYCVIFNWALVPIV